MKLDKITMILGGVLLLSLASNFYMAGMVAGRSVNAAAETDTEDWRQKDEQLRRQLSAADKQVLRQAMQDKRSSFHDLRQDLAAVRKEIDRAMHATPFDQGALDRALRQEQQRKADLLRLMHQSRQEALSRMTPEGQKILQQMHAPARWQGAEAETLYDGDLDLGFEYDIVCAGL